jgi:hypothetical protein
VSGKRRLAGRLSAEDDEFFERTAIAEFQRLPAVHWPHFLKLWRWLPRANPATQGRIIQRALELCTERQEFPPRELTEASGRLLAGKKPRDRVQKTAERLEAARLLARNPKLSNHEIARAAGTSHQNLSIWRAQPSFTALIEEERILYHRSRAHELYARYCSRFGKTFEYGRDPSFIHLLFAVPLMEAALDGSGPVVTTELLEAVVETSLAGKQKIV